MFALLLVLMLGIVALVVDLGNARQQRRVAQASADAAALAGGEAIESGMDRGTGTIPWSTVVTQIKNYAKANDNIALTRVDRVHRHLQVGVPPRLREQQQLHLGDR